MSCPLKEPLRLPFFGGVRTITKRDAMVVRIETDMGRKGYAPGPAHQRAADGINGKIRQLARDMAQYNLTWLEEPLPPDDHEAYAKLREQRIVPIATGEHEHDEKGFDDLIAKGAADYLQMDLLCQGGIEAAKRLFEKVQK